MALATQAYQPRRGALWVLQYLYRQQMMTPTHSTADKRLSEKVQVSKILTGH